MTELTAFKSIAHDKGFPDYILVVRPYTASVQWPRPITSSSQRKLGSILSGEKNLDPSFRWDDDSLFVGQGRFKRAGFLWEER